jgi:capsular exopolysaccharide synthesis family protein
MGILLKHWLTVSLALLAGLGAGLGSAFLMVPQYESTAALYVSARTPGSAAANDALQGGTYVRQAVLSYVDVANSAIVLDRVVENLGLDALGWDAEALRQKVTATSPTNTVLIKITAKDTDPRRAADIANATAQALATVVMTVLEKPDPETASLVNVTQIQEGQPPANPSSPRLLLNLAAGGVLGLAVGVVAAWLHSVLDTRIHSMSDLRNVTGAPLLGTIPFDPDAAARPLVVHEDPRSPAAEEYRALRTNIVFTNVGGKGRCLVISSANPAEGKSTTVANLAIVLADSGARVALVDCDFRRPAIAHCMRIEGGAGLSDVLVGRAQPVDVLQQWGTDRLYILPSGRTPPNPSELLGSVLMQDLMAFLLKSFDYVLLDSPPLLVATDATVLSRIADGVVLVASHETTRTTALVASVNALALVGSRLIGTVLTKVPVKKIGSYRSGSGSGYGYGYGYGYEAEAEPAQPAKLAVSSEAGQAGLPSARSRA